MTPPSDPASLNRRDFIRASGGLGFAGLAASANPAAHAAAPGQANPWAYDVTRYETTDPKLIGYTELRRFKVPRPEPRRLALGPDGRLWITAGNYLVAVDEAGQPLAEIALTDAARCATVGPDGTLFVGLKDHVEVFDARGARQAVWEAPKKRTWLSGLAATAGTVFAADSGNRVVWCFDRAGKVTGRIGEKSKDREIPGFILPSPHLDVELHPDGLLRVNNTGRHQVEAYTHAGDLETSWGKASMAIDGFCGCCNPIALAVLPDGRVVTAEKGLPRVKVYGVHGALECVVAGVESFPENARVNRGEGRNDTLRAALDVVVDRAGRIHVLDPVTSEVRTFAPKPAA
jgi:hypothetical protein